MVREFYTNSEEKVKNKAFVNGKWVTMTSEIINELISAPDHEEDDYSVLMDEGVKTKELEKKL